MKALGFVVSDKKIFENCILKTYFLTPLPTYATNWNGLNNFGKWPPRDHSCEVWSKSNEWFQRRSRLNEKVNTLTHWRTTDKGVSQKLTRSSLCSGEPKIQPYSLTSRQYKTGIKISCLDTPARISIAMEHNMVILTMYKQHRITTQQLHEHTSLFSSQITTVNDGLEKMQCWRISFFFFF